MPTPVVWTPHLISRFWDGLAQLPVLEKLSFARLAGPALVEFLEPWLSRRTDCLDYGGGSGHLVRALVGAGYRSASFEPSSERAALLSDLLAEPLFLGAVGPLDRRQFDSVVCTEVIEHIRPVDTHRFMKGLVRRVKPGGRLVLSTPYAEDLEVGQVYCPVCDSSFHRWQHQRNWTLNGIRDLLERYHLEIEWIGLVGFGDIEVVRDFTLRRRLGEPWPWCTLEPDGTATPVLASGDHIVVVCRRLAEEMSLSRPDVLLAAGYREAQRAGCDPIIVTPSATVGIEARTLIVDKELFEGVHEATAKIGNPSNQTTQLGLVFPASFEALERAIAEGRVPDAPVAWVFEQQRWHRVRRNPPLKPPVETKGTSRMRKFVRHRVRRRMESVATEMRTAEWARRLQTRFDNREDKLIPTLLSPGDFPYRMPHIVSGRVLLAIGTLGSGGAERQLINTAEGLAARGIDDVHILVNYLHDEPSNSFYLEKAASVAVSVRASPTHYHGTTQWALSHPEFREVLGDDLLSLVMNDAQVIRELSPEIVHCNLDWTNVTVGLAAILAGVPHVLLSGRNLSPVHFEFFQWFMYPAYRAMVQCPRVRLLNNSTAGGDDYALWLHLERESVTLLRNGLHTGDFSVADPIAREQARKMLDVPSNAQVVMGAFRLSREKRPLLWVESAARILQQIPAAYFLLCGIGPMSEEVKELASKLGLADRLKMLGARPDIQTVFAASDVVLQASLQEGTPNVLIEAQASGLPVVSTPAFGAQEAIEDGVTGRLVLNESAGALAAATVEILRDDVFRSRVRAAGPRFVESRFGFERMIDETLMAYAASGAGWALALVPFEKRYLARVRLDPVRHEQGFAWVVRLPELQRGDEEDNPQGSRLILLEDGRPLGPPHSEHTTIREQGGGIYSHWGEALYFSSSDGTNPSTNGREYLALMPREYDFGPFDFAPTTGGR